VERLLSLASAVPVRTTSEPTGPPWLGRASASVFAAGAGAFEALAFTGEGCSALAAGLTGGGRMRWAQFALLVEEVGVRALPIMTLIGTLIGIILAFGGALQLKQLGVQIFVADVVGIAIAREVGALMTAILLAGRTGAAFAAQLGSMQVKEEIDALSTAGISPVQFLVLPRVLALVLMTPVLTIYADLFGTVGGGIVAITILDLSVTAYVFRLVQVVSITDFGMGLVRAVVFGILIAMAGCLRGMQSGRSAAAVGLAATSAVVTSIVLTIIADGLLSVIFLVLRLCARHGRRPCRPLCPGRPASHRGRRPRHGVWRIRDPEEPTLHGPACRGLRRHGRKRLRQEHAPATSHRAESAGARRR